MHLSIVLTLDDGQQLEGEVVLGPKVLGSTAPQYPQTGNDPPEKVQRPNFDVGIRAFMKRHGAALSGPKRFALMVAYFSQGSIATQVPMFEVERAWNKMKPLMGGAFNSGYAVRAKDEGWVDSPKRGSYVVLPGWQEIIA